MCPRISDETRMKMSLAKKGNQNAKGTKRTMSMETRKKMSESHIGKKHSDKTRMKISNTMKNKHKMEE